MADIHWLCGDFLVFLGRSVEGCCTFIAALSYYNFKVSNISFSATKSPKKTKIESSIDHIGF